MGVNSGRHNRTHNCINRYRRLDSFSFSKIISVIKRKGRCHVEHQLQWSDGKSLSVIIYREKLAVTYSAEIGAEWKDIRDVFYFEGAPNNYGGPDRLYFLCPSCGGRVRFLYLQKLRFKCRICTRSNYYSQQVAKGTMASAYRMERILWVHFKINTDMAPMDLAEYIPQRPKYMHKKSYNKHLLAFREAQEEYYRHFISESERIMKMR